MDFSKKYKLGSETPLDVSQYIGFLNEVLKRIKARVVGEISELKIDTNGHIWFSLRDKKDSSVLRCVAWKSVYRMCGIELKEGMEIIISGYSDIYPVQGSFTFKSETIELVGEGALKKAYDMLKKKLSEDGLFDPEKKRPIPEYPNKIGVITSLRSGAVIHDFTSNLGKFGFKIKTIDSRVEGQEAVKDLLDSLEFFKKQSIDVLVIIRGGGSLQSLMAFDNELLVREISSFPVPVIAGIGHHKDITLVALAADVCESTPTAVANVLNKSWEKASFKIEKYEKIIIKDYNYFLIQSKTKLSESANKIIEIFDSIFENYKKNERNLINSWYKIGQSLIVKKNKIQELKKLIFKNFEYVLKNKNKLLLEIEKIINYNNPEKQLKLGYAIARYNGKILKKISSIKIRDIIELQVSDGTISSEVKKIIK